jgi:hypothetical protein
MIEAKVIATFRGRDGDLHHEGETYLVPLSGFEKLKRAGCVVAVKQEQPKKKRGRANASSDNHTTGSESNEPRTS